MGAADVVPGVSGGTIALITGIYRELIFTLSNLRPRLFGVWWRRGFAAFWREGNLGFLTTLLAGIVTSILLLANLIVWLMTHYEVPVWSFFCGLILASIAVVLRPLRHFGPAIWAVFLLGVLTAGWVVSRPGLDALGLMPLTFFLAGSVAICAMILPGISGSFILLLLGMYLPVLEALRNLEVPLLSAFVVGCVTGLLAFVHLLRWLLERWHDPVMALLAGFMAGSLARLWPWRVPAEEGAVREHTLWPAQWSEQTGEPALVVPALLALAFGVVLVWLLSRRLPVHNEHRQKQGDAAD